MNNPIPGFARRSALLGFEPRASTAPPMQTSNRIVVTPARSAESHARYATSATKKAELENSDTRLRTADATPVKSLVKATSSRAEPMRSRSNSGTCRTDLTSRRRRRSTDFVASRASVIRGQIPDQNRKCRRQGKLPPQYVAGTEQFEYANQRAHRRKAAKHAGEIAVASITTEIRDRRRRSCISSPTRI